MSKISSSLFVILMLIVGLGVGSSYAMKGTGRPSCDVRADGKQHLLQQMPAEKEMLYHQVMRDAREKSLPLREQIEAQRQEMKEIMIAVQFDEVRWQTAAAKVRALHQQQHEIMQEAVVSLARQFTAEERQILVQLCEHRFQGFAGGHRRSYKKKI
ncbi:MAG: periplasmic heavy metal sensor [Deltaproteobacteria bacterium]|nr:periplasmic heavy metal sensor [Candidatus Anaeroferrophillus wilburensis]MBN2888707.1 periplasmic heavy metal sensor [Deltaproteobacteria bacterium]